MAGNIRVCVCVPEREGVWFLVGSRGLPPFNQLCPYRAATGMLGNGDDAMDPVTPIIHVYNLRTAT